MASKKKQELDNRGFLPVVFITAADDGTLATYSDEEEITCDLEDGQLVGIYKLVEVRKVQTTLVAIHNSEEG